MQPNKSVLIVAQSGRALATSAVKAGISAYVVDRFNDLDTAQFAADTRLVDGNNSGFNRGQLKSALMEFNHIQLDGVITGSGFESDPCLLEWISQHWPLIGNSAETVKLCKDPNVFFPLLDELEITHPEICFTPAVTGDTWLHKQIGGTGGQHISESCGQDQPADGFYYQKKINGRNLSAVFLANGRDSVLLGLSETWCVDPDHGNYSYLGAVSLPDAPSILQDDINCIINKIVRKLQITGLSGLDFVIDDSGSYHVLEINPRPTATFELHECTDSLLQAHIIACTSQVLADYNRATECKAHRIVYADTNLAIPDIQWPDWVSDIPMPGKVIIPDFPVCTVHATGKDIISVKSQLVSRLESVNEIIRRYQLAA